MRLPLDPAVTIIDLNPRWTSCAFCGRETLARWGIPIDAETGLVIPTWLEGVDWAGQPACEACYLRHALWSERLAAPFEAPLC